MTARIIDLDVIRNRKAQAALPHHDVLDNPLFDSTPNGRAVDDAYASEAAEYARLAQPEEC